MPEAHAKLSASGAARWMACTASVRMEEQFPDTGSPYAEEGTFAHNLAELILRYNNNEISKKAFTTRLNKMKADKLYSQDMEDHIRDYTNQVWEIYSEAKAGCPDAVIRLEQHLDLSDYVPEGFGRGDVVIIADGMLQIIDLKYGKGVGVSAENNPQLRLYALGAVAEFELLYDIRRVRMTIIQPRLDHTSSEEMDLNDLEGWGEQEVKPRALAAFHTDGVFQPGDHCRFCKARKTCRARAEANLELTKMDFRDPDLLEDAEIGEVLAKAAALAAWVNDIQEYALEKAVSGKKFEGWKLVEGRSVRKYADPGKIEEILISQGFDPVDIHAPVKLLGLTEMTKLLGGKRFEDLLGDQLIKPEGKPVLVPGSDHRPELCAAASAQEDFQDELL